MLDIGWTEVLVIGVVALFVIGPKDVPKALRTLGQWAAKIRGLAREFRETVDDAVRETELEEVKRQVESASTGFREQIRGTIDPDGELTKSLESVRTTVEKPVPGVPGGTTTLATPSEEEEAPELAKESSGPSLSDKEPEKPMAPAPTPAQPAQKEGPIGLRHLAGAKNDSEPGGV